MLAILYGLAAGNTSDVALKIQQQLREGDLLDVLEIGLGIT